MVQGWRASVAVSLSPVSPDYHNPCLQGRVVGAVGWGFVLSTAGLGRGAVIRLLEMSFNVDLSAF